MRKVIWVIAGCITLSAIVLEPVILGLLVGQ